MKTILSTADAPAAIGPYSQAVRSGETLYCSGQLGIDPATGKLPEGVAAQTVGRGLEHCEARGGGYRGVDGVAAAPEDVQARLRRQRLRGADHPAPRIYDPPL